MTFRLREEQPELRSEERTVVANAMLHFDTQRYQLDAFVVMNDHVHALVRPTGENELEKILHSWKSFTAYTLQRANGRRGALWLREYYDRVIRDDADWLEKMTYIVNNPTKRWPDYCDYPWVHPKTR